MSCPLLLLLKVCYDDLVQPCRIVNHPRFWLFKFLYKRSLKVNIWENAGCSVIKMFPMILNSLNLHCTSFSFAVKFKFFGNSNTLKITLKKKDLPWPKFFPMVSATPFGGENVSIENMFRDKWDLHSNLIRYWFSKWSTDYGS